MSPGSCGACRYWTDFYDDEDDGPVGLCGVPKERLPLSMRGMAMAEKVPVKAILTGCPTYAVRLSVVDAPEGAV